MEDLKDMWKDFKWQCKNGPVVAFILLSVVIVAALLFLGVIAFITVASHGYIWLVIMPMIWLIHWARTS